MQLLFVKTCEQRLGLALARPKEAHVGAFRRASHHRRGDLGEHVSLHVLAGDALGVYYRGVLYVSEPQVVEIKNHLIKYNVEQQDQDRGRPQGGGSAILPVEAADPGGQTDTDQSADGRRDVLGEGALGVSAGALAGYSLTTRPDWGCLYPRNSTQISLPDRRSATSHQLGFLHISG